jgi:hypothetical protein
MAITSTVQKYGETDEQQTSLFDTHLYAWGKFIEAQSLRLSEWQEKYFAVLPELKESQFKNSIDVWLEIATFLNEFQAIQVIFERTPEDSILCKAVINAPNDSRCQLFLALYFDETEPSGYEAILNVFQEKKQVLAVSGEFEILKKRLHQTMLANPKMV